MLLASIINGIDSTQNDLADRGFQFGDGLFETLLIEQGVPRFLERHLSRLKTGCQRIHISQVHFPAIKKDILRLSSEHPDAILKVIVTRGCTERGYLHPDNIQPTIVMRVFDRVEPEIDYAKQGISVQLCHTRLSLQPLLAGIKHLNRLEQVLARREWDAGCAQEGLLLDTRDNVIEATMSNLFYVKDDCLVTPRLAASGVAGIMRSVIIDIATFLKINSQIEPITMDEIKAADEVFLSNSLIGIWPVTSIHEVAEFERGAITDLLQNTLRDWSKTDKSDRWYSQ